MARLVVRRHPSLLSTSLATWLTWLNLGAIADRRRGEWREVVVAVAKRREEKSRQLCVARELRNREHW